MSSLLQVRDTLELNGAMAAAQLSRQLATPLPMIEAMLERLCLLGKVESFEPEMQGCLSGSCKSCPQGENCAPRLYRMKRLSA